MVVTNAKSKGTLQETADMQMVNLNKYIQIEVLTDLHREIDLTRRKRRKESTVVITAAAAVAAIARGKNVKKN